VSSNAEEAAVVAEWLAGSPLAEAFADVQEAELLVSAAKRRLAKAKKKVAEIMSATP